MQQSPTDWKAFVRKAGKAAQRNEAREKQFAALSRFAARYRVASSAKSMDLDGLSQGTADAYFASLRITLAYTALEALEVGINNQGGVRVINEVLASMLRSQRNSVIRDALLESLNNKQGRTLRQKLVEFYDGESDDLRDIAYALRNLMCHGTLTAARLGLDGSKSRRLLLHDLADEILRATDQRFSTFVKRGKW